MMVVVADSVHARIFSTESERSSFEEIKVLTHPEARLHDRDITSDLPGKNAGNSGSGGHAYVNKTAPKKHEQNKFASEVASYLEDERKSNNISSLMLFAAPEFLGELRSNLSSEINNLTVYESSKNIVTQSVDEIRKHIPKPSEYKKH